MLSSPPSAISQTINDPTTTTTPTTRRRGLSYLRSLSSRDTSTSANTPETAAPKTSPRHFFTRSTSYQETKESRSSGGRRRSQSYTRPNEPTGVASSTSLARVASEQGNSSTPAETNQENQDRTASTEAEDMSSLQPSITQTEEQPGAAQMARSVSGNAVNGDGIETKTGPPTIRFYPHQDQNRNGRQSLNFSPISRTLPSEQSIIRVGRYSEREGPPPSNPSGPSDAPVGFKSKVVSRKHCEFCFVDGQWNIKDVASSSGTFLNHIRLSQPNQESRLYPIKDGDIVQLGIDFRGGEEMIFRCVKIRIECNRSWQKKPNNFNKQRQAQLRGLAKDQLATGQNSGECSICLGGVLPCQALFVAPCAHVWHYKCIRPMLEGRNSQYPQFQCPNCRAYTDLEADVDVDMSDWADESSDPNRDMNIDQADRPDTAEANVHDSSQPAPQSSSHVVATTDNHQSEATPSQSPQNNLSNSSLLARRQDRTMSPINEALSPSSNSMPMPARPTETEMHEHLAQQRTQTESPNAEKIIAGEGPLTPRNNAGPFVFDGSGSRTGSIGRRHFHVPSQSLSEISDGIE